MLAMAIATALSGCVSYTPMPLSEQHALDVARNRSLDDPQLQADVARHLDPTAARPPVWTFDSLTWVAYRFNPELAVTRAKLGVARAAETTAGERLNPTLSLPFEYASNPNAGDSPYTIGLALDIPIETGGKRDARLAQAAQLSRVAELELGEAAWQVRSRLRGALLDWRHGQRDGDLLAKQEALRSQVVEMLSRRLAVGEAARPELVQVDADLSRVRLQRAASRRAIVQAQGDVAEAIGVPLAAIVRSDIRVDDLERLPDDDPGGQVLDDALKNRTDVQSALANYGASQAALQLAVASQYPDIHLGPGFTFDGGAHKYVLSLSGIELPLFNHHRGEIDEADARRGEAAAKFEAVMTQAVGQIDQAVAALRNAREQWTLAQKVSASQERAAAAARHSFGVGSIGRLELVQAELQAEAASVEREDAFDHLLRAAAALEDAVQRPLNAPSAESRKEVP